MHMLESKKFHFPRLNYKFHFREVTSPTDYRADLLPRIGRMGQWVRMSWFITPGACPKNTNLPGRSQQIPMHLGQRIG